MKLYHVCDLETTGYDPYRNEAIVIAFRTMNEKLETIGRLVVYLRPNRPQFWSEQAKEKAHKIELETALTFPEREESVKKIILYLMSFGLPDEVTFVCHAKVRGGEFFDWSFFKEACEDAGQKDFMKKYFRNLERISTHTMAREFGIKLEYYGLKEVVMAVLGIEFVEHHEAMADCDMCADVFIKLLTTQAGSVNQAQGVLI